MIVYRFEVFRHDWLAHLINTETQVERTIINDPTELYHYYQGYRHTVWISYNANYQRYILQGILANLDPYLISKHILSGKQGWDFSDRINDHLVYSYDTGHKNNSLKQLQAFMGHEVKQTSVPYDLNRQLSNEELYDLVNIIQYDTREIFKIFTLTINEFKAHLTLINQFKLPLKHIDKSMTRLAAEILGARKINKDDEWDIYNNFHAEVANPDINQFFDRKHVLDETLEIDILGVPHKLGKGGIHGARDNYHYTVKPDEYLILMDVEQMFPNIMLNHDLISRGARFKSKYKWALNESIRLKRAGKHSLRQPFKDFCNKVYGASGDRFNKLYDPRNRLLISIFSQTYIVDLIEKLTPHVTLIQTNTDGILISVKKDNFDTLDDIVYEWEQRTGLKMDFEFYDRVHQKDVNNYILIGDEIKTAGNVKDLSPLDNDLPIINKAIREYFINSIPVERTIMSADQLIDFQRVVKVSDKFDGVKHGNGILNSKALRVFADTSGQPLMYLKNNKTTKVQNTPDTVRIVNGDITDSPVPDWLDLNWYIDMANKRVKEFIGKDDAAVEIKIEQERLW